MALAMALRSRNNAVQSVARQLAAHGSPEMVITALIATHLRAQCEIDAARAGTGIHTLRLVEATTRNVAGLVDDPLTARPLVNGVLERLGRTGDLSKLSGGNWQATPPRFVSLGDGAAIILGAVPERLVIVSEGAVRYASEAPSPGVAAQRFDDWLGREEPIGPWMARAMRAYSARLQTSGVAADSLQVYAPDVAQRSGRSSWLEAELLDLPGVQLRLCRANVARAAIYNRPYFLGEFVRDAGGVRLLRAAQLVHGHARRFRFGFDRALGVPRRVRCRHSDGLVHMTLANDLPPEEDRVLALGWSAGGDASPGVRRMMFPPRAIPFVTHAFGRLGMTLEGGM